MRRGAILIILLLFISFSNQAKENFYDKKPPMRSAVIPGYCEDVARRYFDNNPLSAIEGVWEYSADMVTLAIERFSSPQFSERYKYRIILVDAEDKSILPGTVVGYVEETAQSEKYYIWLYGEEKEGVLSGIQKCAASIGENNTVITFKKPEIKFKIRINFSRFLPTLFRGLGISAEKSDEKLPLGFRKIYPVNSDAASPGIRYL